MTVEDVAGRMAVSPAKISRIETAARGISLADVRFLCDLYGVTTAERDRLISLTRESRRRSWWQQYGLPESGQTLAGLEDAAVAVFQYETSFVPALLQDARYAAALTSGAANDLDDDAVALFVKGRLTRQKRLTAADAPEVWAIVDEAALHRVVGGAEVMRTQLLALIEASRRPKVVLQVVPFEAGAHPGMDSAFTLLHLEEVADVVYVEGLIGQFFLQSANDLARYRRAFDQLRAIALSPNDSRLRISAVADTLA
jgi:transcriptional regulator with XRE-family HTH domain